MLGAFTSRAAAAAAGAPSFRPHGTSLAARAVAAAASAAQGAGDGGYRKGTSVGIAQPPRAAAPAPAAAAGSGAASSGSGRTVTAGSTASSMAAGWGGTGGQQRPRWADEEVPCDAHGDGNDEDAYMDIDAADADREEDDADGEEGDGAWASPEDLRQAWLAECRAVKALEAQGRHEGSAALAAAKDARDAAEASWRKAVGPKPVSIRMGRAQQRLDRAAKALERARLDLEEYEQEAERKRDEFRRRVDEAEERYWSRSAQLDELHAEAGELAAGAAGTNASRRADDAVCGMVAAELQALAESLDDGSETRGRINLLLAKMATAVSGSGPQQFDIGDEDGGGGCGGMAEQQGGKGTKSGAPLWAEDSSGRWNRRGAAAGRGDCTGVDEDEWQTPRRPFRQMGQKGHVQRDATAGAASSASAMGDGKGGCGGSDGKGTAEGDQAQAPTPTGTGLATAAGGQRAAGSKDDTRDGDKPGKPRRREEGDEEDPHPKFHRGEDVVQETSMGSEGDDAARAQQLLHEQAVAVWAAKNAQSMFGDDTSRAIAGQLYAHKVQLVERRARDVGVVPRTDDGRSLVELAPEDFTEWVRKYLEPAEREARESKEL
jgi:hypothetical protein